MLLRKRAEEILDMVHKTESEFSSIGDHIAGDIHIGGGETEAMRQIARLIREIRNDYPEIRFHLFSGNAEDVTERLDKGILDFGLLIQPVDILKYDSIRLPDKVTWGVVMRRDSPLAEKQAVTQQDLLELPLICSRQVVQRLKQKNEYSDWFGENRRKMEHCCDLQPDLQRRIDGEGGDRLCDCPGSPGEYDRPHRTLFPPLETGTEIGNESGLEKVSGVLPGRTAFSGTGAGKIRSENRKHAEAASLLPGSCPDRK